MESPAQRNARSLIEKIHRELTLDGSIKGTRFELLVSNCLEILSSQLYEKSTHFLLELIQNADDNTYDCSNPSLSFSYKPGSLRIDCNEVGFTSENVEAICAISRSTKSCKTKDGEYIGEKGIGFKSVFKAAEVVWIASREFTFKFDTTNFLGMVAPLWAEFPEPVQSGCTSIYLQLSKTYEEETLVQELLTFDTNLLIFLRRVEEINIRVARRDEQVWESKIRKEEIRQDEDRVAILHKNEQSCQYLIRTHTIKDLPKERKRPDWPQTKMLLAFPTTTLPDKPRLVPQNVYAFLPVRNYGLKFLVQADFLLTASREDIESTLPWNRALRDALTEAFIASVHHFNKGKLKYVWPYYLPSASLAASNFLEPAITSIWTQLRESAVLESCAKTMVKASSLKYVPLDQFGANGKPFTLSSDTAATYLSPEYPVWAIENVSSIGVSRLTSREFLKDLDLFIQRDEAILDSQSEEWHSQLSDTLNKLAVEPDLMSVIQDIRLIPLHDGSWTSARGKTIFFSKGESSLDIPSGIEVLIVDSTAETSPNRRKLFSNLGVKAWEAPEICRLVLRKHESPEFDPKALKIDQLISHAAFLYKASWQPPKSANLWFATAQGERCPGRQLYVPGSFETDSPAGRIFAKLQERFPVIHKDYLKSFAFDPDWLTWLVANLGLSKTPRLVNPHVEPAPQSVPKSHTNADDDPFGDLDSLFGSNDQNDVNDSDFSFFDQPSPPKNDVTTSWADLLPPSIIFTPSENARRMLLKEERLLRHRITSDQSLPDRNSPSSEHLGTRKPLEQEGKKTQLSTYQDLNRLDGICGVVSPAGIACTHSLRCETHSISARRAVLGRSTSLDLLLAAFDQKRDPEHQQAMLQELIQQGEPRSEAAKRRQVRYSLAAMGVDYSESPSPSPEDKLEPNGPPTHHSPALNPIPGSPANSDALADNARNPKKPNTDESHLPLDMLAMISDDHDTFALSDEFDFMFKECHSSDVLQLLREDWGYYSKWIDGAHMNWQSSAFIEASKQLKDRLGSCMVQIPGRLLPLRDTVLPKIDCQLDEIPLIPAVEIEDPQHPGWSALSYFGVTIKPDIHYYLRCLLAMSADPCPDVDTLAYIYEQIQARYKENVSLISSALNEQNTVFVRLNSTARPTWTNMRECLSRDVYVESEYPTSAYLFRCFRAPNGDPLAALLATANRITASTSLEEISCLFRNISTAVKDLNATKAAQLLKPFQTMPIFPVINNLGKGAYDNLTNAVDTSWFIADRPQIRDSFLGKTPLLALPVDELPALEFVFIVMKLHERVMSSKSTSKTTPKGRIATHWAYMSSLRAKRPFIKALVPQLHPDRISVLRQIDDLRVSVATEICETFFFTPASAEIQGNPVRAQVSLSRTKGSVHLFMTEDCAANQCPPYELVHLVAGACGIEGQKNYSLLYMALSDSNMHRIYSVFKEQGILIQGLTFEKPKDKYRAQRRDLMRIPSPFWSNQYRGLPSRGTADALRFEFSGRQEKRSGHARDHDRRLPIIDVIWTDQLGLDPEKPHHINFCVNELDGWEHVQHLGEHMVSKILKSYLGQAYDPERHWTSDFRSKSGYKPFGSLKSSAAFTLIEPNVVKEMTTFLIQYGDSPTAEWKQYLRANLPVYHMDLVVSTGSKYSSFAMTTSQVERMRKFRMHDNLDDINNGVSILVRVSDIYHEDPLSVEFFVDPWRLFDSDVLELEPGWLFKGSMCPDNLNSASKRRKLHTPFVSWGTSESPRVPTNNTIALSRRKRKDMFTYRCLETKHIRLLYLLPGETHSKLQGVITHAPYDSDEPYRALSYVWGTDLRTDELITPDGFLPITTSLNQALVSLRHKTKAIMLWVDAICINQNDNKEKAQQIRLLPKIFQSATSTYAFLNSDKECDAAMEMLMQVRAKAVLEERSRMELDSEDETGLPQKKSRAHVASSTNRYGAHDWPSSLSQIPAAWKDESMPNLNDAIWTSVKALFSLPWFRRVWIIQEVVAAPVVKIVCGQWTIDWNDLFGAMEIVNREVQLSDQDVSPLKSSWEPFLSLATQREWEARNCRWTLLMLLENFRYAESTLIRDRLFALLGLASDGNEAAFEPDYESPLGDILVKFARVFVDQGRGMQLLYRAGLNTQSDRFPSWIPDWTVPHPSSLHDSSEGGVTFSASGPQDPKIKCIPNTDELLVEGYTVDAIQTISNFSNIESQWDQYFAEIDTMIDAGALMPLHDSRDQLKWKVPIAGVLYPKTAVPGGLKLSVAYDSFRKYLKGKGQPPAMTLPEDFEWGFRFGALTPEELEASLKQSASYMAALRDTLVGWRFVVTKGGYVGVVPNLAQVGDVVAIFKGGRVPFVVRKSSSRQGAFQLVGECYVHSIMNGEGLSVHGVVESEFRLH